MTSKDDLKAQKKRAKAEAKAVKKGASTPLETQISGSSVEGKSPAERSAEAAERQLQFHKWRVVLAAVSAIIALVSFLVLLLRSRGAG